MIFTIAENRFLSSGFEAILESYLLGYVTWKSVLSFPLEAVILDYATATTAAVRSVESIAATLF